MYEKLTFEDISALSDSDLDLLFGGSQMPGPDHRFDELHRLMPDMEKRFRKKGMTLAQLRKDYKDLYKHGYQLTQFYRHFIAYKGRGKLVMQMEYKAGDKMYVDFAGEKLSTTDQQTGEVHFIELFVAILGCSQLTYAEAVHTQCRQDSIGACENALTILEGCQLR